MNAAILLVTLLVRFPALRSFFAVTDSIHAIDSNTERKQEILGGIGSSISQAQIVFLTSSLVTVPLDTELDVTVLL